MFVTTKIGMSSPEKMVEAANLSLKRLRTDCVDCMLIHGVDSAGMMRDDVMRIFDEMKTAGKARFIGVSTHDHEEVPDLMVKSGFWDMLTIPYNYFSPPETSEKIRRVREAGIAVVGMKNLITIERPRKPYPDIRTEEMQAISNQQALLKWALNNKYIDTVIPGISSFEHLADDVAAMGSKLTTGDRATLKKYGEKAGKIYCRGIAGCTGCKETCPYGVDMGELNRCVNYATGYGNIRLARENYDRLPLSGRVDRCDSCESCKVKCVNGLNPNESIRKARALFG
jgi:predicted aldo/keto reductase-like oxidoreductase